MTQCEPTSGRAVRLFDHRVALHVDVDTPLPPATGPPDLVIAPAALADWTGLDDTTLRYVSRLRMPDGGPRAEMYQVDGVHIVRFGTGTSFRVSTHTIDVAVDEDVPPRLVTMQLLGPVMSLWLERHSILTLHGAAVQLEDGTACGFVGPKGSGKSTLAATMLGRGHALVSEDVLAIDTSHPRPRALSSYPELRLWPAVARRIGLDVSDATPVHATTAKLRIPLPPPIGAFADGPAPLARVYVLRPAIGGVDVRIEDASPRTAIVELLRHSFSPRLTAAAGLEQRRLPALAGLIETTAVRLVHYPADLTHLADLGSAVAADLETCVPRSSQRVEPSPAGSIEPPLSRS